MNRADQVTGIKEAAVQASEVVLVPPTINFREIVSGWKTGDEALSWAVKHGIEKKQLGTSSWLNSGSSRPFPEGINRSLAALYRAIKADPRFQTDGKADFDKWREFIGCPTIRNFPKLLASWAEGKDALSWARSQGITKEQLGSSTWLQRTSAKAPPDGINQSLSALYFAIKGDPRFQTGDKPDFNKWRKFLGLGIATKYNDIVASWTDRQAALDWAALQCISYEQLTSYYWLVKESARSRDEGGFGKPLRNLYSAIVNYFGSFRDFKVWLSGRDPRNELDKIKDLFSSSEALQLRNLAEKLGECALAEYLVAAHPDKFTAYSLELIENLRAYLGKLEQTNHRLLADEIPNQVLVLDKLSYLRQAYFNYYRDLWQPEYAKGLNHVVGIIEGHKSATSSPVQREFLESLAEYFREVDSTAHPARLKDSLEGAHRFPAAHQLMAMYEIAQARRMLLADEMGGGKTGSAIGCFEMLRDRGKVRRALVICPAKILSVWKKRLTDSKDGYFKEGEAPSVAFVNSSSKDWLSVANADYTVISLEMLRGHTDESSNVEILRRCCFDLLIFDEAHNAKSIEGDGSDAERVFSVSQSPTIKDGYTILLSGTPIPNTLSDLSVQLRLLYSGTDDQSGFNVNDLRSLSKQILRSHPLTTRNLLVRKMMRRNTEDTLPVGCEYRREQIEVGLNPVARAKYAAVLDDPFFTAGAKIGALRRICLNAKFEELTQAIQRVLDDSKYQEANRPAKIVVAESAYASGVTRDREDKRKQEAPGKESYIYSRLLNHYQERIKVFVLDGKNSSNRVEILEAFAACTKPAILLTLVSVSGEGLNITCAADGILISPTYTVSGEEQFIRRMLRSGQTLPVRLQVLCFSDSIEDGIFKYSVNKHRAVAAVIDGRPLNKREKSILNDEFSAIKKDGPIAYESLTPQQQAMWILRRLKGLGKDGIRSFLYADNSKYAKDFARGYLANEERSISGNTARLVAAVINQLSILTSSQKVVADIACACRTLERMYEGSALFQVKSVDINQIALNAGAALLKEHKQTTDDEIRTMDDLPFNDCSIDIGVISLALNMTQHGFRNKRKITGQERIRTIIELNRVIKPDGYCILSFQKELFWGDYEFNEFVSTIETHFGFSRVEGLSGFATARNHEESGEYASWIVTLKKTASIKEVDMGSDELRRGLRFPRVSREVSASRSANHAAATNRAGAYQDKFLIGSREVLFEPSTQTQLEAGAVHNRARFEEISLGIKVTELIRRYRNIRDIPPELLLSITPDPVSESGQQERNDYYRELIDRYGSEDNIPTPYIMDKNSHILIRRHHKANGYYLCLVSLLKDGRSWIGYNTRYFYDDSLS